MIRNKTTFALATVAAAMLCVASAQASSIHLTLDYAGSYDSAFTGLLPGSPPAPLFAESAPHPGAPNAVHVPGAYHQFDVYMTLTGTVAGEDFQTVTFDFVLGPGVTSSDFGWSGASPTNDPIGPPGSEAVFTSGDFGTANDLKGIGVVANPNNSHIRTHNTQPGEAGGTLGNPTLLGSAYVFWNGTFGVDNKSFIGLTFPANTAAGFSTVIGNVGTAQPNANYSVGPRQEWVNIVEVQNTPPVVDPEPAQNATAGQLVTTTFTATDLTTPSTPFEWSLAGTGLALFTPAFGDQNTPFPNPAPNWSIDPLTGVFTWNTLGFRRGIYDFVVNATDDGDLTSAVPGHFLVTITAVPEPSTFALCGLAMVGLVGTLRRRSA
jgi:PEP-CTERM motif